MTKFQINYFLFLLTVIVGWCFFNTMYKEAKMDARIQNQMAQLAARPPASMMNPPGYPYNPSMGRMRPQGNYMQNLPPETQRMLDNFRAAKKPAIPSTPPSPDLGNQEKK
ncbi:MAG TPA: hypothetical protein PLO78_09220 [Candidatus Omnitrophota bacterium]|nr:hypothetical protein [Candidatus Omnitrophota bacterium]